jgi:hypothetical protein
MSRMRTLLLAAVVAGVAACSDDAVQPDTNSTPAGLSLRGLRVSTGPEQVMPGEVVVKLKAGVMRQQSARLMASRSAGAGTRMRLWC